MRKRLMTLAVAASFIVGSAGIAAAIPTADPSRPTVIYVAGDPSAASIAALVATTGASLAGEGAAPNACIGLTVFACTGSGDNITPIPNTAVQHMDYLVTNLGGGLFSYQYQFENSSISFADIVTIVNKLWSAIGVQAGDLDVTGPHNLTGESEAATLGPDAMTASGLVGGNASWDGPVGGILVGHESITLTLLGGAPIFAVWLAQNDFSWSSNFANPTGEAGRRVLAPSARIPEPASLFLLGTGLVGAAIAARRRSAKSK